MASYSGADAVTSRLRRLVLRKATDYGMVEHLRLVQLGLSSAESRRNSRDDDALKLLIRLSLPPDAHCVDVGAHVGAILSAIVDAAPFAEHIAYEPLPDLAAALSARFPRVDVRAAALARESGTRVFRRVLDAPARSGFHADGLNSSRTTDLTVPVHILDESLPAGFVPYLIKIDVEGGELDVLEGAMTVLTEHRPIGCLEHGGPADATLRVWQLLCEEVRLRVFDLDGVGPLDKQGFLDSVASGKRWNFLFRR